MPRNNRRTVNATRKKQNGAFDWEDPGFLSSVYDLAYEGFYDIEIADEMKVNRSSFRNAKDDCPGLRDTLERARARAKEDGVTDMPSLARFRQVWEQSDGKRSRLMELFKIGWTTFQSWCAQEPRFVDIMAERDLKFLEQGDIAGRILALGAVKDKDKFPGWERHPDTWMLRWYMNTLGRRYGYGENPVMPELDGAVAMAEAEDGINIEEWIIQEMTARKNREEKEGKEDGDDTEP